MKSTLIPLVLALTAVSVARADFNPVALNPTSFNHDVVVEKTAPPPLSSAVTATQDQGTNNAGNTWYEIGYNTNAQTVGFPNPITTGLPLHGSRITNGAGDHVFVMPPDYTTNNAIMVGHHSGTASPIIQFGGTLTLTTPAAYQYLSFLNAAGNGPARVGYVIHYADSTTESNTFDSLDWFNAAIAVYTNLARINIGNGAFDVRATNSQSVQLYNNDVLVANQLVNITSIDFYYAGVPWQNGRASIFAVSGSTDATTFQPIAVTGFTYDVVLEAGGPPNVPLPASAATATMDGGTNRAGNTWYEAGYFARLTNSGLPAPGTTITSATLPSAHYTMPASYTANNAAMLDSSNPVVNLSLSAPAAYGGLAFLVAGANGDSTLPCVVQFQDGTSETNVILVPNWFNTTLPFAFRAWGRVTYPNRSVNNTPDQVLNPPIDNRTIINPLPRLFDAVIALANTTSAITNVMLTRTNVGGTQRPVVFAVSGSPAGILPPFISSHPAGFKNYEGTNNIVLSATVPVGTPPVSYQWKKAPKGGGVNNIFDYSTFANVVNGGNISGANTNILTISNATLAASGDYVLIVSNAYGSFTSVVATVTVLTTNINIPVGVTAGDIIAAFGGASPNANQNVTRAIDRVIGNTDPEKWVSNGLNNNVLPWLGPAGFVLTPVQGASVVTSIRFYAANDNQGRDPADYTLEGSNDDGATWIPITSGVLKGTGAIPTGRNNQDPNQALNPVTQNVQEVDFANAGGYKSYRFSITNNYTPNAQAQMQIGEVELLGTLVPNPPLWTRQPVPTVTVFAGASPTFGVNAVAYPLPKYQWKTNGVAVPGATNSTYTFPNAQLTDSGRTFSCTATNIFGTTNSTSATLAVIAAPTQSYPSAVLGDSPIAYWRLNEIPDDGTGNNGKVTTDYRGGHNGSYSNTTLAVAGYNTTADSDTAAQFGSVPANSYVGNIQDLGFASPSNTSVAFSVEAWTKASPQSSTNGIVTKGAGGSEQFNLDSSGANPRKFRFFVRDAAGGAHIAQSTIYPDDKWHHLVGVCDQPNGIVRFYVDGLEAATGDITPGTGLLSTPGPVTIGARQTSVLTDFDLQFNGIVDEVAVYNVALSAGQALNHYYAAQYPPVITLQPSNAMVAENISVTFYSSAYGPPTLDYQWYLSDGANPTAPISGQTSSNLTFTTTAAQNNTFYQLVVTNGYGAATSSVAQLTVVGGPPSFLVDLPTADTFLVGHVIQLRVEPGGTAPFTYQWQKNSANISENYRISGSHTKVLTIAYANFSDSGNYQVLVGNGQGNSPSALDLVTATNAFSAAPFSAAGTGWSLQGSPPMSNNRLELTSGSGNTARSAFLTDKQSVATFIASFVYQTVSGAGGADGITFCIQNDTRGAAAVGGGGGGLGYSGITPSFALGMNIYDPNTRGVRYLQNGALPAAGAGAFMPITPVLVGGNANPIQVNVSYSAGVVSATFRDLITPANTFTTNYTADIPAIVGSSSAYAGFTGADGGVASTQVISNFTMTALAPSVRLNAQRVGDSLVFSWPASVGGVLRSTPTLSSPVWTDVTALFQVVSNQAVVTVSPLTGIQFYRLDVYP